MDSNPHNLKTVDEKPSGYLDAVEFIAFCNRSIPDLFNLIPLLLQIV